MVAYQPTIKDFTSCPRPQCPTTATGYDAIIRDFGLRNMGDGTTRVQSWCRKCRKESCKGAVA